MVSTSTSNSNSTMAVLTTLLDIGPTSPLPFNTSKELLARWSAGPCAHRDCKYAHPRECYSCDALFCPEHKKDASCHPCVLLKVS